MGSKLGKDGNVDVRCRMWISRTRILRLLRVLFSSSVELCWVNYFSAFGGFEGFTGYCGICISAEEEEGCMELRRIWICEAGYMARLCFG